MHDNIFLSSVGPMGDLAGVFEYDGEKGYLYLFDQAANEERRIVASIDVLTGPAQIHDHDVAIRWSVDGHIVGLFIRDELLAGFQGRHPFGGANAPQHRTPVFDQLRSRLEH